MAYTLLQISAACNRSNSTMCRQIKILEKEKKFVKKTPGKLYSDNELKQLERIFDFKYREQR